MQKAICDRWRGDSLRQVYLCKSVDLKKYFDAKSVVAAGAFRCHVGEHRRVGQPHTFNVFVSNRR